jgi:hypothetical protein
MRLVDEQLIKTLFCGFFLEALCETLPIYGPPDPPMFSILGAYTPYFLFHPVQQLGATALPCRPGIASKRITYAVVDAFTLAL